MDNYIPSIINYHTITQTQSLYAETNPAGTFDVFVSKIWNPNSSIGSPNSTNLFSYTLIVSL
jgi:hypothetical protein